MPRVNDAPSPLAAAQPAPASAPHRRPIRDLPELTRGKGNKLIGIPASDVSSGAELLVAAIPFGAGDELVVHAGQRYLRLKGADLDEYRGERARRGRPLPRGFQRVDKVLLRG